MHFTLLIISYDFLCIQFEGKIEKYYLIECAHLHILMLNMNYWAFVVLLVHLCVRIFPVWFNGRSDPLAASNSFFVELRNYCGKKHFLISRFWSLLWSKKMQCETISLIVKQWKVSNSIERAWKKQHWNMLSIKLMDFTIFQLDDVIEIDDNKRYGNRVSSKTSSMTTSFCVDETDERIVNFNTNEMRKMQQK